MKKVYLIYATIPSVLFDNKISTFVKNNTNYKFHDGYYRGLYAWTTKKKLLDEFLEFRDGAKSMYTVITREFSKDEYNVFKRENSFEKLSYYKFYHDMDSEDLNEAEEMMNQEYKQLDDKVSCFVCTREEYEETYDTGPQYLMDYMSQIVDVDYIGFTDEFKDALDKIGYCDLFNQLHDGVTDYDTYDEFYSSRNEMTEFNRSYNLSFYGNEYVDIYSNKSAIFINIFYEMIFGYNPNNEIKLLIYR